MINRAQRRAAERAERRAKVDATPTGPAGQAIAWVKANPIEATNKLAELERAMASSYGIIRALAVRQGPGDGTADIQLPRGEWQGQDPSLQLTIAPDDQLNLHITVAPR